MAETSVAQPAGQPAVRPIGPLSPLTDLAVRRIMLGDKVAAAKFGTGQPIDDPVREQQVLDTVAARSAAMGLPPAVSVRFFQAQIEANKIVQRGLVRYWRQHPAERPVTRPDLATEVRPQLDRITGEILRQLRATIKIRRPDALCGIWRLEAELSAYRINHLDKLHRNAVAVSLRPICET
ncbi:MAG: gamma subclass chorismate mutase AroQ [Kibdelosporangium sp.]